MIVRTEHILLDFQTLYIAMVKKEEDALIEKAVAMSGRQVADKLWAVAQ